ncbi:unnamed protein product [Ixodes pacificus]
MAEGDDIGLYLDEESDSLKELFAAATQHVQSNTGLLSTDHLLYLYARYKQAHEGSCKAPKPAFYDIKGKQKWDAWNKLGDLCETSAMREYVERVEQLFPNWSKEQGGGAKARTSMGPVMSTLQHSDEEPAVANECKDAFDWVKENNLARLRECLESESRPLDAPDDEGLTLLHWACDRGHRDVAKLLLDSGADVHAQDQEGQTPLHYASSCGHLDIARLLLERGALLETRDSEGLTPAQVALDPGLQRLLSV